MRWNALTIAGVLLLPTAAYAGDLADTLFAQAQFAQAQPTRPMSPGAAPAPSQTTPGRPATPTASPAATQQAKFLVFFDWDKATLTPEARRIIANAAEDFKKSGSARIVATGHTDTSGSPAYNMRLSVRRAEAVKAELVRLGVPASEITTIGRGEEDLLVPTKDGVREAQNRRVSIEFPLPPKPVVAAPPPPAPTPAAAPPPPPPPLKWAVTLGPWYGYNIKEYDQPSGQNQKSASLVGPDLRAEYWFVPTWGAYIDLVGWNTVGTSRNDGYGGRAAFGLAHQWNLGKVHPYIGPKVGYAAGKGVEDSVVAGPEVGLNYDVSEKMFVYARVAYDNVFKNDFGQGIPNAGLGAGLRF